MKCLIKNKINTSVRCLGLQGGLPGNSSQIKTVNIPEEIDLNNCFFHAIGTYLLKDSLKDSLMKILDSQALLSEEYQQKAIVKQSDIYSFSPKCNNSNEICICQKQSFIDKTTTSESFNLYAKNHLSIILSSKILKTCNAYNNFESDSNWLDGELRVQDKIPIESFVGIGVPCDTYQDIFSSLKEYGFSQQDCLDFINSSKETSFLRIAEESIKEKDVELPLYSITSGKIMGNKYVALNEVFTSQDNNYTQPLEQ